MERKENGIDVSPGPSSFGAMMLSAIRSHSWDKAITVYEEMKEKGIVVSPHVLQGLIMAHSRKSGRSGTMSVVESILQTDKTQITESTFRLISKVLFKEVQSNLDDFRRDLRGLGEKDHDLRDVTLNLIRSIRVAEIESNRSPTPQNTTKEIQQVQDKAWLSATKDLLELVSIIQGNRNGN
jgi:pentatricopeptide repeat protein